MHASLFEGKGLDARHCPRFLALAMSVSIELAKGAEENGLASMLSTLVDQNLAAKPHKQSDFAALNGTVAIVAQDADVALTMRFELGGKLTIHDGIVGIPDVTIRGPADAIMAMSNMPLATRLGLPLADPRDREAVKSVRTVAGAMRDGSLHIHGIAFHLPFLMKLTRVMSVNG